MGDMSQDAIPITEFRKNTKVILDSAVHDPVYLRRGDEIFVLSLKGRIGFIPSEQSFPGKNNSIAAQPFKSPEIVTPLNNIEPDSGDDLMSAGEITTLINKLQGELDKVDTDNQDPDYWNIQNDKKAYIQELWAMWHKVTGR